MTFLPIVGRELRVRARWPSTYWVRMLMALVAIGVATATMLFAVAGTPGQVGHGLFAALAWMTFVFCVVDGFRNTADSLSEEKREGTLGLLFLTDLRGYDVVLGKFAGMSLGSLYGLLAVIPALAIPVLLGGVTGAEFWRVVAALLNALFFSLCAGMFVSALSRQERRAWSATALIVILFVVLLPLISVAQRIQNLSMLSPTGALLHAFDARYAGGASGYWSALALTHLIGWCCLAAASAVLPRAWQESRSLRRSRFASRRDPGHARTRRQRLAINPIWWLTARHDFQRRWLWALTIAAAAIGGGVWLHFEGDVAVTWTLFGCAIALHFLLAVWVASEACYSFADARSSGAMELLLSTPLTVRQILRGQHLAIRHLFGGPVILLVSVEFLLLCGQLYLLAAANTETAERIAIIIVVGFSLLWFVVDLFAVSRVGMWFGLTSAKPTHALTKTILFVLVLPLAALPCCTVVGPGLMLAKGIIFFTWAQNKLDHEFRTAATRRFEVETSWWKRRAPPKLKMPR